MTPDEVIHALNKIGEMEGIGLVMTRPTLLRYETQGLIPKPQRGGRGRGAGRWTEYPAGTVEQAYAAWCLMHGVYGEEIVDTFDKLPRLTPKAIELSRRWFMYHVGNIAKTMHPERIFAEIYEHENGKRFDLYTEIRDGREYNRYLDELNPAISQTGSEAERFWRRRQAKELIDTYGTIYSYLRQKGGMLMLKIST